MRRFIFNPTHFGAALNRQEAKATWGAVCPRTLMASVATPQSSSMWHNCSQSLLNFSFRNLSTDRSLTSASSESPAASVESEAAGGTAAAAAAKQPSAAILRLREKAAFLRRQRSESGRGGASSFASSSGGGGYISDDPTRKASFSRKSREDALNKMGGKNSGHEQQQHHHQGSGGSDSNHQSVHTNRPHANTATTKSRMDSESSTHTGSHNTTGAGPKYGSNTNTAYQQRPSFLKDDSEAYSKIQQIFGKPTYDAKGNIVKDLDPSILEQRMGEYNLSWRR